MSRRDQQFVELFAKYRLNDQALWYSGRIDEYDRAKSQVITLTGILLFASAAAGILASWHVGGTVVVWAVAASILSALSTTLTAYDTLIGFEHTAKLYRDTVAALDSLRVDIPDVTNLSPDPQAVDDFVSKVEAVFRKEEGQWGQLIASTGASVEEGARSSEADGDQATGG